MITLNNLFYYGNFAIQNNKVFSIIQPRVDWKNSFGRYC